MMDVSDEIRKLIMGNADASILTRAARKERHAESARDGWRKICDGVTSVEEVMRVTQNSSHDALGGGAGLMATTFFSRGGFGRQGADGQLVAPTEAGGAGAPEAGLTPIYVRVAPKNTASKSSCLRSAGGRRDVLFFTQELSTLLNAGVPSTGR